ncbi:MAG: DedA family protein [Deltaproteobacteria bacterium]|nr:DedA family protein [Deltaproteobacteria bacterium]
MQEPGLVQSVLDFVAAHHGDLGLLVIFGSSLIEYVFPPFPGDVITLFGTYLVVKGLWSFPFALGVTTAGSLVGAGLDYGLGIWIGRRLDRLPSEREVKRWTPLTREKYTRIVAGFRKHGVAYIAINRFLPGIRAFFFVAAGAARMRFSLVMLFAALSAVVWNGLLLGVGYSVGANWERLRSLFTSYTTVVWALLGAGCLAALGLWLVRRRRASGDGPRGREG